MCLGLNYFSNNTKIVMFGSKLIKKIRGHHLKLTLWKNKPSWLQGGGGSVALTFKNKTNNILLIGIKCKILYNEQNKIQQGLYDIIINVPDVMVVVLKEFVQLFYDRSYSNSFSAAVQIYMNCVTKCVNAFVCPGHTHR